MQLYIKQIPAEGRPLLAGDHTNWSRPDAVTLQERTYEHSGTSIAGNKPITIGQGYSTIAWIPEKSGSWALPLRHERITSAESPIQKAGWQLKQVCKHLAVRPISVWDSEYGCAPFLLKTASIPADILVRLRSNLCLWGEPGARVLTLWENHSEKFMQILCRHLMLKIQFSFLRAWTDQKLEMPNP